MQPDLGKHPWLAAVAAIVLASCSGGGGGGSASAPTTPATPATPTAPAQPSSADAARFLTQATFGPDDASISAVTSAGYSTWIDQQTAMAVSSTSHVNFVDARLAALKAANANSQLSANEFEQSFWAQAAAAPDQLRQRMKLALSEIYVISMQDTAIDIRGAASYYDMLGANAFGNFRNLLQSVTLHPMMGVYLTSLANQPDNATTGQHPDENYAREVMQLMTIGLWQLNMDGSQKLDGSGNPIATYGPSDITGMARVLTGFSWYSPNPTNSTFLGNNKDPNATITPMIAYSSFHSTLEKDFLGVVIPASTTPDPNGDLKIALDTLFNHPNTAPFVSKQLIQRLVTSNPSPGYVQRVATVFANNGSGVRGDMAAVVKAILTDTEARDLTVASGATFGKVREPVVRMANWMRAFKAQSASGAWLLGLTSSNTSLNQATLYAGSVFNFWRPGYSPPNTQMGSRNLVVPEFQAVDEVSVGGYLNTMQTAINSGVGSNNDITAPYASELGVANDANALADRMNAILTYGQMSAGLHQRIVDLANSIAIPGGTATAAQISAAQLNRVKLAVFTTMASPEYLIQR